LTNNTAAPDTIAYSAAISPDGNYIASGWNQNALLIWETHNLKKTARYYKTSDEKISAIAWSPNSRYLITGGVGGIVEIWDVQSQSLTPAPVFTYAGHTGDIVSVSWAANGWCVASLDSKNKLIVWRAV
jgi:WD40 repeat protein